MEQLDQEMLLLCYQLYSDDIPDFLLGTQFATKTVMFPSVEDRTILLEGYSFGTI